MLGLRNTALHVLIPSPNMYSTVLLIIQEECVPPPTDVELETTKRVPILFRTLGVWLSWAQCKFEIPAFSARIEFWRKTNEPLGVR